MTFKASDHRKLEERQISGGSVGRRGSRGGYSHSSAGSFVLKTEGQGGVVGSSDSGRGGGGGGQGREVSVVVDAAAARDYLPAPVLRGEGGT